MAGRGRGRGRGLLAATIQPQVVSGAGDCSDRSSAEILQDDIRSAKTTTKPKQLSTPSSTSTNNSFHLSSLSAPKSTSSLSAAMAAAAKPSLPSSSTGPKGFSSLSQRSSSPVSSSAGQRNSSPLSHAQRSSSPLSAAQRSSSLSGSAAAQRSSSPLSAAQRSSAQSGSATASSAVVATLDEQLSNLYLYEDDSDMSEIINLMKDLMVSSTDMKEATELLYKKCVADVNVAKSGALICNALASVEVEGSKFRSCILRCLQKDFEGKDKLHAESSSRFLGFFTFLCQVFAEMRTSNGEHFLPLITPIFNCVNLMLGVVDGEIQTDYKDNADDIECVLLQFQSIGKTLETCDEEKMLNTMETVRAKIINNGTSPQVRCTLLELVESYGRRFEQAPNEVTRFYCETMAEILAGLVV